MSFLLRPMIWYKFIGGMVALKGKYRFSSFPQPCLQMHITAFPNGAGHLSALWRTKRVARMWGCYIQLQQEAALRQTDMFRGKCLNFDASVGCQTILPALVHDRADASAEGTSAKGDMGDRDHDRTCAREIVALHPQVGAGKRGSAVLLYIAETTFEAPSIRTLPWSVWAMLRTPCRHSMGKKRNGPMISEQSGASGPYTISPLMPGSSIWQPWLENQHRSACIIPLQTVRSDT